ncbi:MAG: zinc ribbon domain-containing protein [Candidatus Micrarchaeia archaeon]
MGLMDALNDFFGLGEKRPKIKAKCPKCKADIDTSMERCPGCGTHVELLLRFKCPECGTVNGIKNKKCEKCGYPLWEKEKEPPAGTRYVCPICNYKADYYMLKCPACGTRFV